MYDDYSYNYYAHTERQLGKSCDEARCDLLAAEEGGTDPINLNIGAIFSGQYGPMPLETIGCASGKFDHLCDVLETMVPDNRVIDSVKFHHFHIKSDRMISKIESAIKTKHIKELEFEKCFDINHPSRKGIDLVSRLMEGNQNLEKLTVDVGILNSNFTNALRDHPTLETLDLANFSFRDEQVEALMEAVKDKSDVSIRTENHHDGRMEIAHLITPVLATNPQLEKLRLRGVELLNRRRTRPGEDENAILKSFARALSTNSNLIQLTLDGIRWEEQTKILLKAIYDDSSLNTLAMSNHTCQIFIDDGNSNPTFKSISEDYKWIQGGETSIARKSKLLCAIGTFDESCIELKRFSEGPSDSELLPKLIPMMLAFVQDVHIFEQIDNAKLERLAFKNVYELMRNIVAPSLQPTYDHHDSQAGRLKRKRDVAGAGTEN